MNDLQIYKKIVSLLESRQNAALVTVVDTVGSTPGKVGYKMLVWGSQGQTLGTVGGGLAEAEMINAARNLLHKVDSRVFRLNLSGDEDERGICGGTVEFLIETFDAGYLSLFEKLSTVLAEGRNGIIVSLISTGQKPAKFFAENANQICTITGLNLSDENIEAVKKLAAKEDSAKILLSNGIEVFIETVSAQPMLVICGAGHIATHIVRLAGPLGFRTTVCDERPEYANRQRFPDADNIIVAGYQGLFDKINMDADSYVVIVTRGHKCDEIALEQAIRYSPRYIGMIGSKRKTLTILESLRGKGIAVEKLKKVYSPIGLSIGAVTPEEIALSIAAELTKIKRLGNDAAVSHLKIDFARETRKKNQ